MSDNTYCFHIISMEKEVKITLKTKEDYDKLINYLQKCQDIKEIRSESQVNTLYTNVYLKQNKIAVRIRTIDGKHMLTIKRKKSTSDGYFVSDEINTPLNDSDISDFETQFADRLAPQSLQNDMKAANDPKALHVEKYFTLKTTRRVFEASYTQTRDNDPQQFVFTLEIDHVYEPLDLFEIECETENPDEYKAYILNIINQLQLQHFYSTQTKLEVVRNHLGLK